MPNMHMKTAAQNIRHAINDIQAGLSTTKAETDKKIQDIRNRLGDIKNEENLRRIQMTQSSSDQERAAHMTSIQNLEREVSDLNKLIIKINDDYRKAQKEAENRKMEFNSIATKLDGMA